MLELWRDAGIDRPWLNLEVEFEAMLAHDGSFFLVAIEEGSVTGSVMGGYDGRRGWVYHLAVERGRRRQGLGRALMTRLEELMRDRGVSKINLQIRADNQGVVSFYEALGFKDEHLVSMGKRLS